jgi:hypothetical protein
MSTRIQFLGFVPHEIGPNDERYEPRFAGFPRNLLLCGERETEQGVGMGFVCYWFAPETFSVRSAFRQMRYLPRRESPYSILVRHDKRKCAWQVRKYRGRNIVGLASAPGVEWAMGLAGRFGVQDDEPLDGTMNGSSRTRLL